MYNATIIMARTAQKSCCAGSTQRRSSASLASAASRAAAGSAPAASRGSSAPAPTAGMSCFSASSFSLSASALSRALRGLSA